MHQSILAVPIPLGQPRGLCSRCQSQEWGIRNFISARVLGPGAGPGWPLGIWHTCFRKTDKFIIGKDEAFVKDWLIYQVLEKLVDVFKGIFSQF